MILAAWRTEGILVIAKYGDWRWLKDGKPESADNLLSENGGRSLTKEDIENQWDQKINTIVYSTDAVQEHMVNN